MASGSDRSGEVLAKRRGTGIRGKTLARPRRAASSADLRTPGDELRPWVESAACRSADPELFFPVGPAGYKRSRVQIAAAKAVCRRCPVIGECRAWALMYPRLAEFGVWGGTTEEERRIHGARTRVATRRG